MSSDQDGSPILWICGGFRLPDDFDGTVSDALREYADYIEADESPDPTLVDEDEMEETWDLLEDLQNTAWDWFLRALSQGYRFFGDRRVIYRNLSEVEPDNE